MKVTITLDLLPEAEKVLRDNATGVGSTFEGYTRYVLGSLLDERLSLVVPGYAAALDERKRAAIRKVIEANEPN